LLNNDSTFKKIENYINNIKGINIDRNINEDNKFNRINVDGEINTLGCHNVSITLHKRVVFELRVILNK
jgi:ribosomal protein L9